MSQRSVKKRRQYSQEDLEKALLEIKKGKSVNQAAKDNDIPVTTLFYKNEGKFLKQSMGPKPELEQYEPFIVSWAVERKNLGYPVSKEGLLDSVQQIVKTANLETKFKNGRPGNKWFRLFLRRHPQLSLRTSQNLTTSRAKVTEEDCRNWFAQIGAYFTEKNLMEVFQQKQRIFNCDETALYLNANDAKVLALKGDKSVYTVAPNDEKENVTVLLTCNAAGDLAPPMIVFRYLRLPNEISLSVPDDWCIGKSPSGWMRHNTFFEYFGNSFIPWLNENNIERPVLMFLDGHASHDTYHLSKLCQENGIELLPLLPQATHLLQPCDVAVFHAMKTHWKETVRTWREEHNFEKITLDKVAPLLKITLEKTTKETISNGFKGTGLCPWDPDQVKFLKFDGSNSNNSTPIPEQMNNPVLKTCLKNLESFLGPEKKLEFLSAKNNDQTVRKEDESMYKYWLMLVRNDVNSNISNLSNDVSSNNNGTSNISISSNNASSNNVALIPIDASIPVQASTSESTNSLTQVQGQATTSESINASTQVQASSSGINNTSVMAYIWPSPIKNALVFPKPTKIDLCDKKTTNINRRIHAITSKDHQAYLKKKEDEKIEKARAVEQRKELRKEKKRKNEEAKKEKFKNPKPLKVKKKLVFHTHSDTESEHSEIVDEPWNKDSSYAESFSELEEPVEEPEIQVNDFVLVKHQVEKPKKTIYYVGCVQSIGKMYTIKFLRKSSKFYDAFIFPQVENIEKISRKDIVHNLKNPTPHGKTKRQAALFKFNFNFDSLEMR